MQNIHQLRTQLADVFAQVKAGTLEVKTAEALNNTAGKMISTVVAELKYREMTKSDAAIDFMEYKDENPKPAE